MTAKNLHLKVYVQVEVKVEVKVEIKVELMVEVKVEVLSLAPSSFSGFRRRRMPLVLRGTARRESFPGPSGS